MSDSNLPTKPQGPSLFAGVQFTQEQINLVKNTIARGTTNDELKLFLYTAQRTGLDPLTRQMYAIKRWDSVQQRDVMAIQCGIDGYRLVAQRTGEANGQDGPWWAGKDGVWREVWTEEEPPAAAKIIVYRKGHDHGYVGIARYSAYVQRTKEGHPNRMWKQMADVMTAKIAEALALRKAFPAELSGVYTSDEMSQADNQQRDPKDVTPHEGEEGRGAPPAGDDQGQRPALSSAQQELADAILGYTQGDQKQAKGLLFRLTSYWAKGTEYAGKQQISQCSDNMCKTALTRFYKEVKKESPPAKAEEKKAEKKKAEEKPPLTNADGEPAAREPGDDDVPS